MPPKPIHCITAASLLIVFIIDAVTPSEFTGDILYLCCLLLVFKESVRTMICFSAAACVLIIVNIFLNLKLTYDVYYYINRGLSLFAILIATYLAVHNRRLSVAGIQKQKENLRALEEMLFITSHQVRKSVANILGLIEIINSYGAGLSVPDLQKHCRYLSFSACELDAYILGLSGFIEEAERQGHAGKRDASKIKVLFEKPKNQFNPAVKNTDHNENLRALLHVVH